MIDVTKNLNEPVATGEVTSAQTISFRYGDGLLSRDYTGVGTYAQLRAVRKDPTVSLARGLLVSTILSGSWNIEGDDDVPAEVLEFMEHVLKLREDLLYSAVAYGRVDYGWCGFEKIFRTDGNRIYIDLLKPLLHDYTTVLITPQGKFKGYRQANIGWGTLGNSGGGLTNQVDLTADKCLHIAFDVEAGNYYGMPLLENIRAACDMWGECNDGARRYDLKMAGTHWVIKYPPGTGVVNGETVDNSEIASTLLGVLESSGCIAIPTTTAACLQELINAEVASLYEWHVELLADSGRKQAEFHDRLKYLDTLKVRGILMPERSLLEGQFGTKAEAETHGDLAVINMEQIDKTVTRFVNQQLIDQLVLLNYGEKYVGKVQVVALPLVDKQVTFFRDVYKKLTDPGLDIEVLRDKLDLPGMDVEPPQKTMPPPKDAVVEEGNDE